MEPTMKKLDVLKSQLDEHIEFFDKESTKHKTIHRRIRYSILGLTAISTILASLAAASLIGPYINIGVVMITAGIGVLSSIEGLRKPGELWLHERSIYHALEDLQREIEFQSQGALNEEAVDGYFARVQALLSTGSVKWRQHLLQARENDTAQLASHTSSHLSAKK